MQKNIFTAIYSPLQISLLIASTIQKAIGTEVVVDSYKAENDGIKVEYQDMTGNLFSGILDYQGVFSKNG